MIPMIEDLTRHKWHANASLLRAIRQNDTAASDEELRKLLHHTIFANRYWLALILGKDFARDEESHVPETIDGMIARYKETEAEEMEWLAHDAASHLDRTVQTPFLPGLDISIAQALIQLSMHSHGHRAQCATRLRSLGGTPPRTDFVLWLKDRPHPDWP